MISADHFPLLGISDFSVNGWSEDILCTSFKGKLVIEAPHKHDFFVILFFKRSQGKHIIDFKEYEVKDHQIQLIYPDQIHQWNLSQNTKGQQLMISKKWFAMIAHFLRFSSIFYRNHPLIQLSKVDFENIYHEVNSIKQLLKTSTVFAELVLKRCELIALLISQFAEQNFNDHAHYAPHPLIAKFTELVDLHFREERQVSFYSDKLNISANYLNVLCRKNAQISASLFIQNRILLEAKRLLKSSEKSVKDIVYELGFYDQASFSKFFKLHTALTPSEFKNKK